jgi:7-cyano-7-deazaguanine synthase
VQAVGGEPKAVVLLSGGLDSSTVLYLAQSKSYQVFALSFRYGQRHEFELSAARQIAEAAGVTDHRVVNIDLAAFGGSALTDDLQVPKHRNDREMESGIPVTYVPARNTVFLALALAWAEVLDAQDIFLGVNHVDYSGYPDCRPEFIRAFERVANLATKSGVEGNRFRIHAPLIELSKREIVQKGVELGVDFSMTHTCYDPDDAGRACGACDACQLRLQGFRECGLEDPVAYQGSRQQS